MVVSYNALKGRTVTEGEILAELDSSGLDYDISNQQTIVNAAYESSLSGGRAEQLQYQIEQKKLDMMMAEKEKYTIRAPFDGIICMAYAGGIQDRGVPRQKLGFPFRAEVTDTH